MRNESLAVKHSSKTHETQSVFVCLLSLVVKVTICMQTTMLLVQRIMIPTKHKLNVSGKTARYVDGKYYVKSFMYFMTIMPHHENRGACMAYTFIKSFYM